MSPKAVKREDALPCVASLAATREDFAAWWLTRKDIDDCLNQVYEHERALPRYVRNELSAMHGRPLGGRLWVPFILSTQLSLDITKDFTTPFERSLARMGAIILYREDAPKLRDFPGHVTTLELERLR